MNAKPEYDPLLTAARAPYDPPQAHLDLRASGYMKTGPAPGWQWFYEYLKDPPNGGTRYAAGVDGYKQALLDNGFTSGIVVGKPIWGNYARDRTVEFQRAKGLAADGIVGPMTGKALLRTYVSQWQHQYAIPSDLLGKQGTLESNNHAVAEGWLDPNDEGWGQIHLPYYPVISEAQAWDPKFAIKWAAGQLWSHKLSLGDWDAALAAYNVGYATAKMWLAAGKPPSGGPIWHTAGGDVDAFERADKYVKLVRAVPYP